MMVTDAVKRVGEIFPGTAKNRVHRLQDEVLKHATEKHVARALIGIDEIEKIAKENSLAINYEPLSKAIYSIKLCLDEDLNYYFSSSHQPSIRSGIAGDICELLREAYNLTSDREYKKAADQYGDAVSLAATKIGNYWRAID